MEAANVTFHLNGTFTLSQSNTKEHLSKIMDRFLFHDAIQAGFPE
jgi:hypothetical protein